MDGIAGATARVAQIQALVQSLQRVPVGAAVAGPGSLGSASTSSARAASSASSASFEQVLAQARAAQPTAGPGPTGSPAVDPEGVPLDLKAYGNGKVPPSALQDLGIGRHRLWAPAADAFSRLREAASRDGVTIGVTDSYRSYEAQVDVARRKGLYKDGGLAAVPGTSDHGWGLSLDLRLDDRAQRWMRANAGRFGFDENTPREPWHWTFQP